MNTIKIKLNNTMKLLPTIKCNGKVVRLNRAGPMLFGEFKTDANYLSVEVFRYYPLSDKLWFIYGFLFWFVGFFGIFSPLWEKKCHSLDAKFDIPIPQNMELVLNFYKFQEGYRAFELEGADAEAALNPTNIYTINHVARKRRKLVILFGWLTSLVVIAAAVVTMLVFM